MQFDSGSSIGRYEIRSKLGAGGMGEVYLAHDPKLDRKVALKVLTTEVEAYQDRIARFVREAKAAAALNHPNIAHVYEIDESDRRHFIAMEFIDGQTLRDYIRSGQTDLRKTLRYLRHVAEGLAKAHEAGIVHRDLKPENIMISRDGHAKILDFGLAKLIEPPESKVEDNTLTSEMETVHQSMPGIMRGTVGYMAPEQAQGRTRDVDHRSDVFSFGCVLYEAVTGRRAFPGLDALDSLHKIVYSPTPSIRDTTPGAPHELQRIVRRCLAKDSDDRYQTIKDVAIELRELRRELHASPIDTSAPPSTSTYSVDRTSIATAGYRTEGFTDASPGPISLNAPVSSAEYIVSGLRQHKIAATIVVLVLVAAAAAVAAYVNSRNTGDVIRSIAVLPFANTKADSNTDYLADGITESLINSFSQFADLRVVPRSTVFRYKGSQIEPQEIGRKLGARAVLTGRVVQSGDTLNIQTELIDVDKNAQLWGEQYNRKLADVQSVQAEISRQILERLKLRFADNNPQQFAAKHTPPAEAYQAYLKGRYYFYQHKEDSYKKSIDLLNQAIAIDPSYARAYAGLASVYTEISSSYLPPTEAMAKAKDAVQKALALDGSLAEAHVALAEVYWWWDWNFGAAEQEFKRAIDLNPTEPTIQVEYANFLARLGRTDEAMTFANRALQLDSVSPFVNGNLGSVLYFTHQYDRLIDHANKMLEMDRSSASAHTWLGLAYVQKRQYDQAISELQQAVDPQSGEGLSHLAYAYALAGRRNDALRVLADLQAMKRSYSAPIRVGRIYIGLGDKDQAFAWLEKAYVDRSDYLTQLKMDPMVDSLRSDPRFMSLTQRIGFPP